MYLGCDWAREGFGDRVWKGLITARRVLESYDSCGRGWQGQRGYYSSYDKGSARQKWY